MHIPGKSILLFVVALTALQVNAQTYPGRLKQLMNSGEPASMGLQYLKEVDSFYNYNGFQLSWFAKQNNNLLLLDGFVKRATEWGLVQEDYQPALFRSGAHAGYVYKNERDSLLAELRFTDIAIHLLHDVLLGNRPEPLSYNGLNYSPSCYNIPSILDTYLNNDKFSLLFEEAESKQPGYLSVKRLLNLFQKNIADVNFKDAVLTSPLVTVSNKPLVTRLTQLGFIPADTTHLNATALVAAIKEAQNLFDLLSDGKLRSTTLQAFNVPLATRIAELESTLNALRWVSCIKESAHIIVVNIPSATLALYEHGKPVLESNVIVGKRSTPTPTLSSTITEVILYPYWNVPYKIATQELLPRIRRDRNYLETNNYQVLNRNGKVMDPAAINWHALGPGNFPYVIRQSTGCDNALGLIKLNFYNPFSVYLHDTPDKSLFSLHKRYFSHGCMRLEKAMEIAHYILKDDPLAIDTLTAKGCLKNQAPVIVPASESIPVLVLYHSAWPGPDAGIKFYEDIYDKFLPAKK